MRIIFILPGRGGGGGAHSVIQESRGLQQLGVEIEIATTTDTYKAFRLNYPELEQLRIPVPLFEDAAELAAAIQGCDLAVATTAQSAHRLAAALASMGGARPQAAYYIQDYEPLFFTPGTPEWTAARSSYTVLPDVLMIAKTEWLCSIVHENHNRQVVKVSASLDHDLYHPTERAVSQQVSISAMIRPKTPRRAPRRTVRILERLVSTFGDRVQLTAFGCDQPELEQSGLKLSNQIEKAGVLSRAQVAEVLRTSDLFLDLSDFQAFGRTGLESMACGCVPVLPVFGAAGEYARHRENAYLVDPRSDEAILEIVSEHLAASAATRAAMRRRAIVTGLDYSIERAAFSEYEAFSSYLA